MAFDPSIYGSGGTPTTAPAAPKVTGPYGNLSSVGKKPAVKKPVTKKPVAKKATPAPKGVTISPVQGFFKLLLTSSAFGAGALSETIKKAQQGDIGSGLVSGFGAGAKNVSDMWADRPTITGHEIVKQLGLEVKSKNLGKSGQQPARAGRASQFGVQTQQQVQDSSAALANAAMAFGVDVASDPLTYVDGVGVVARLAKAGTVGAKVAVKATKLASKGSVPLKVAAKKVSEEELAGLTPKSLATSATGGYTKKSAITPKMEVTAGASEKGAAKLAETKNKLTGKYNYEVVQLPKTADAIKRTEIIASGLDAFRKASGSVLEAKKTSKLLEKFAHQARSVAKQDSKAATDYVYSTTEAAPAVPTPAAVAENITPPNPNIFSGQKAVSDTAPVVRAIADTTNVKDIKDIKSVLAKINRIAKSTEGVTVGSVDVFKKVRGIVNDLHHNKDGIFLRNLTAPIKTEMRAAISADGTNPFILINSFVNSKDQVRNILGNSLMNTLVATTDGTKQIPIKQIMSAHSNSFAQLAKADPELAIQIAKKVKSFYDQTDGKVVTKLTEDKVSGLLGAEAAKALKAAGAFDVTSPLNPAALEAVLKKIPSISGGTSVKYKSFLDMVEGLKSGHDIPIAKLESIVKAIDPQNALIKQTDRAAQKNYAGMLRHLIKTDVVNTASAMQQRWNMMNADTFFKATGLHLADGLAAYADARLMEKIPAMPEALLSTRQAAAENTARLMETQPAAMADALNSLARAFEYNFDYMREIMTSPDYLEHISSLNDVALRSTEKAYMSDTKAILHLQTNQSLEAKIFGSIIGLKNSRMLTKAKGALIDGPAAGKEKMAHLASQMKAIDDAIYATLGARITHNKWVKQAGGKLEDKHYIYLHIGDVASELYKTESGQKAFIDAFFPHGAGIQPSKGGVVDSFSTIGLGSVVRQLLEARSTGAVLDTKDLVTGLKMTAGTQKKWSSAFSKSANQRAEALLAELNKPEVLDKFDSIHKTRAVADIESNMEVAHAMNLDIMQHLADGMKIAKDKGIDDNLTRLEQLRTAFAKLAFASDVLKQQRGDIAESMLRVLSMIYLNRGKLRDLTSKTEKYIEGSDLVAKPGTDEYSKLMEIMNNMFRHENPDAAAPLGREALPFPNPKVKDAAQNKLTEAMLAYEKHYADRLALTTKAEVKTWLTTFRKLQKQLDTARENAWKNWIDTKHFDVATQTWISSSKFDHAASTAAAQKMDRLMLTDGTADLSREAVDTAAKRPTKPATKAQVAEVAKKAEPARQKRNKQLADGAVQEAAQHALDVSPEIAAITDHPAVAEIRTIQEFYNKPLLDSKVVVYTNYGKRSPLPIKGVISNPRGQQLVERMGATNNRSNVQSFMTMAESSKQVKSSNIARALNTVRTTYNDILDHEGFASAFGHWAAETMPDQAADPIMHELVANLNNILNPMKQAMQEEGFSVKALQNALAHYGLTDKMGFKNTAGMTPEELAKYFDTVPFAPKPPYIDDITTIEGADWAQRTEAFKESGADPFTVLTRFAMAVQHAKSEKALAENLVSNFGHEAFNLTAEQARAQGWVEVKGHGTGVDLTSHFPTGDNAVYFHPDIAPQIGSLNREWNAMSDGMRPWLRTMMNAQSFWKSFQTVLVPRHHIVNIVGDTSIAMMYGTVKPSEWFYGNQIANIFGKQVLNAEYLNNRMSHQIAAIFNDGKSERQFLETVSKDDGKTIAFTINGKKVYMKVEDLAYEFQQRGIGINNIFNDEVSSLSDSVLNDMSKANGAKKTFGQKVTHGLMQANKVAKPAGDLSAWYGNASRAAHAIHIGQKRAWKSADEMFAAMADEIHITHPTMQSLASGERKVMRPLITYYTWLRVAHSAMIDMTLNHAWAVKAYPLAQYEVAKANGLQPISPAVPWSADQKQNLPDYLTKSIYGPTNTGGPTQTPGSGPTLFRPPVLPLDVMETWNVTWDPTKTFEENVYSVGQQEALNVAKMGNLFGKAAIAGGLNWNLDTNKSAGITNTATFANYLYNTLGISSLTTGLGITTPTDRADNSNKPLTPADRNQKFWNFFTGAKQQYVNTPANLKIGSSQKGQRQSRMNEQGK